MIFYWTLLPAATIGFLLWKSGIGAFLLGAMNDMASGYNEQYEIEDNDNSNDKSE